MLPSRRLNTPELTSSPTLAAPVKGRAFGVRTTREPSTVGGWRWCLLPSTSEQKLFAFLGLQLGGGGVPPQSWVAASHSPPPPQSSVASSQSLPPQSSVASSQSLPPQSSVASSQS